MQTRTLDPTDAESIAKLWIAGATESAATDSAFTPTIGQIDYARSVRDDLADKSMFGWGMFSQSNGTLLGYLTARASTPSAEFVQSKLLFLLDLDVDVKARRMGIASKLVQCARTHAAHFGFATVEVGWLSQDPVASSFWRSQGFVPYLSKARVQIKAAENDA
ncbi:MAG: GNAT family N-acetyltransferase [Burkholderiales bacterium]|nr:GNAT family N-acetyltransferase [Burkholderiales bacterium]